MWITDGNRTRAMLLPVAGRLFFPPPSIRGSSVRIAMARGAQAAPPEIGATLRTLAGVVELADTIDLGSIALRACRFKSCLRYFENKFWRFCPHGARCDRALGRPSLPPLRSAIISATRLPFFGRRRRWNWGGSKGNIGLIRVPTQWRKASKIGATILRRRGTIRSIWCL